MQTRLTSKPQRSSCLWLLSAEIEVMCQHISKYVAQIVVGLNNEDLESDMRNQTLGTLGK